MKIKNFNPIIAADIMRQLLSAINYCHKRGIVHRDLKLGNILIDSNKSDKLTIKVIDFGTAGWFTQKKRLTQVMGTPYYIAPEVLEGNYNEKCDVWSCGVALYVLLSGKPPFCGRSEKEIFKTIKEAKLEFTGMILYSIPI